MLHSVKPGQDYTMTAEPWSDELTRYLREVRARDPIPARSALSLAQEFQCRILGGHLIQWLQQWGPRLIAERNALAMTRGATDEPAIVFVTDTPGLVAAAEILGDGSEKIVFCRPAELEVFPGYKQDETFSVHCELHSYFEGPGTAEADWQRARNDHPPGPDEVLWLHHDCSMMGPRFARGTHHVWFWNGSEARLVQENWETWIS